ncbi:MAG: hypothetical protein E6J23_10155 [Chloroflexi bacterium]|nr:MAG: hypothetical protein E6J23_10155 [Chloroflexota bacterium]
MNLGPRTSPGTTRSSRLSRPPRRRGLVTKEVVAFYARVSSDEQREQHTIQTQLEYARGRAKLDGWTLREFIDDGVSGKKVPFAKRSGGAALLEAARRGEVSRVVTYRLDRVGRRAKLIHEAIEDLARAGVPYASLTEPFDTATPAGRLFLGVLAVMAEFESDSIAQRTSDGKKRAAGIDDRRLTGVIPYGYARGEGQRLVIDPRPGKRKTVKLSRWERPAVSRILKSEIYAGRAVFFKRSKTTEAVYRNVPAIVATATYLAARKASAANKKFGGAHRSHDYRLRGLIKCGRCKHTITGRQWRTRQGYYCLYCPAGQKAFVEEASITAILWRDVLEFLAEPDATLRAIARSATEVGNAEERAEAELVALAQKYAEFDFKESQLVEMRLGKTITPAIYDDKFRAITAEREQIQMQMQALREERAAAARAVEESAIVRELLGTLRTLAEKAGDDPARRTQIIRTLTKEVAVYVTDRRPRLHVTYAFGQPQVRTDARQRVAVESTPRSTYRPPTVRRRACGGR